MKGAKCDAPERAVRGKTGETGYSVAIQVPVRFVSGVANLLLGQITILSDKVEVVSLNLTLLSIVKHCF